MCDQELFRELFRKIVKLSVYVQKKAMDNQTRLLNYVRGGKGDALKKFLAKPGLQGIARLILGDDLNFARIVFQFTWPQVALNNVCP
jgi:hypothetical protein